MRLPPPLRRYSPISVIAWTPETVSRPNSTSNATRSSRSRSNTSFPLIVAGALNESDLGPQTSDFGLYTADFGRQILDVLDSSCSLLLPIHRSALGRCLRSDVRGLLLSSFGNS